MNFFNKKRIITGVIVLLGILLVISIGLNYSFYHKDHEKIADSNPDITYNEEKENTKETADYFVEIKGAVKKPGVYKLSANSIINELVKLAGGLNKNAYTNNINLSRRISNEMVLYVYTKTEYKKKEKNVVKEIKVCPTDNHDIEECTKDYVSIIESTNNTKNDDPNIALENKEVKPDEKAEDKGESKTPTDVSSKKININSASLEELMTLNGIGEAKAKLIINYRNESGKFMQIEDIKKVKGIGDAMYEKIKESIMV